MTTHETHLIVLETASTLRAGCHFGLTSEWQWRQSCCVGQGARSQVTLFDLHFTTLPTICANGNGNFHPKIGYSS